MINKCYFDFWKYFTQSTFQVKQDIRAFNIYMKRYFSFVFTRTESAKVKNTSVLANYFTKLDI